MRFLADECCPRQVVDALRDRGHDVVFVAESLSGSADPEVAATAIAQDRVLITEDYGFGELAVRHQVRLPGLIILAMPDHPPEARANRVVQVVATRGQGLLAQLVLIDANAERVRPLGVD